MYISFMKLTIRNLHSISRIAVIPLKQTGEQVTVRGWVQNVRKLKKNLFIDVNDGSSCTDLQVVVPKSLIIGSSQVTSDNSGNDGDGGGVIGVGDSLEVIGNLSTSPQGNKEIQAEKVNIIGKCKLNEGYPFTPKQIHPPEYIRDYLHLRSRVSYMSSILRIRHNATKLIHNYFSTNDFVHIHTPILTENDCEGAGEVFIVRPDNLNLLKEMKRINNLEEQKQPENELKNIENIFFNKKVYLSVSGQFGLEAISHSLGNTYTFGPIFRAENSRSPLHLSEFYMLEAELAFINDLNELTNFIENMIKNITEKLLDNCKDDLLNCSKKLSLTTINYDEFLNKKWITVKYDEAIKILENHKNELRTEINLNEGFTKEQELLLVKYFSVPVFIVNWPKMIKPFYMKTLSDDPDKVYAVDLLAPNIGELIGGSLRENDYELLKKSIPDGLEWYLDLRKYGSIPTGGFGMGFERYLQLITGIKNIRDVTPFPRYPHNCRM